MVWEGLPCANPLCPPTPFRNPYATEELKGDRVFMLRAVWENPLAFQYATEELKGDRDMVMAVVARDGHAFQYATEELRGDRDIVLAAAGIDVHTFQYAIEVRYFRNPCGALRPTESPNPPSNTKEIPKNPKIFENTQK